LKEKNKLSSEYIGRELELFESATVWKTYWANLLRAYVKGKVADVGAGLGESSRYLMNEDVESWDCVEPDLVLAEKIINKVKSGDLPKKVRVINGTLHSIKKLNFFDTIVYIDVLEHIKDDAAEIEVAFQRLRPGGNLILLVPAFQQLYSDFDKQIGHFRRYDIPGLKKIIKPDLEIFLIRYIDSMGYLGGLLNKKYIKKIFPKKSDIFIWDKIIVRVSKLTDVFFARRFGKSIICVCKKS
jgi:2-polyprenyl-3-methyl-5-hydroxy-6-metoxy-1,4-benzoquinol methylase